MCIPIISRKYTTYDNFKDSSGFNKNKITIAVFCVLSNAENSSFLMEALVSQLANKVKKGLFVSITSFFYDYGFVTPLKIKNKKVGDVYVGV